VPIDEILQCLAALLEPIPISSLVLSRAEQERSDGSRWSLGVKVVIAEGPQIETTLTFVINGLHLDSRRIKQRLMVFAHFD
jgi:hypothetical protein